MSNKRKGFTLVELLIVIVVIGILSAMMMLSSTEATTSARASNVVSNMRNLKTAALAYYTDNLDEFSKTPDKKPEMSAVVVYLNNSKLIAPSTTGEGDTAKTSYDGYGIDQNATNKDQWYITYDFSDLGATDAGRVRDKLKGRAKSSGLLKAANDVANGEYDGVAGSTVYMRVK